MEHSKQVLRRKIFTALNRKAVATGLLSVLLGCGADPSDTTAPVDESRNLRSDAAHASRDSSTSRIARAIAVALGDSSARNLLRDSWRDSRLTSDHKLVLQDWFPLAKAQVVVTRAASSVGRSNQQFLSDITGLPVLDFYVPVRKHRQTWKGTDDILVGFTYDLNAESIEAFRTDGTPVRVFGADLAEGPPLIILHPAEPKPSIRSKRKVTPDEVIEPEWVTARRASDVVAAGYQFDPEEPIMDCDPYCEPPASGGGGVAVVPLPAST